MVVVAVVHAWVQRVLVVCVRVCMRGGLGGGGRQRPSVSARACRYTFGNSDAELQPHHQPLGASSCTARSRGLGPGSGSAQRLVMWP